MHTYSFCGGNNNVGFMRSYKIAYQTMHKSTFLISTIVLRVFTVYVTKTTVYYTHFLKYVFKGWSKISSM